MVRSGVPRKKSPVTPPGIDPGTSWLVAQFLNHYATPGPCRNVHTLSIQYTCILHICVSTSVIVMHYTGWGCEPPNHQEIPCCNGNCVFDLHDFDLRIVFQECIPGIKRDLSVLCTSVWCSFLLILSCFLSLRSKFRPHHFLLSSCICFNLSVLDKTESEIGSV
jgi:hypothetical protein